MQLKDKIVLVTGTTTGIGEAIVERCVQEGVKVMVQGRKEDRAQAICQRFAGATQYVIADLCEIKSYEKIVAATVAAFGGINCLVNNAAVTTRSDIDTSDEVMYDSIMDVNLKAPLMVARAAIKEFRRQGKGGAIVNIGSLNAFCGQTDLLVYSMSKGGLMTMTSNLGDALGPEGIRVNQVNVGWTVTRNEIDLKRKEGFPEDWESKISKVFAPSGKLLQPRNVAAHVLFWLSEDSAPVSGTVSDVEQYPLLGRNLITVLGDLEN